MNRYNLIYLATKYNGDYQKIIKAISSKEEVFELDDQAITIFDEAYPKCFFELKNPPLVLFYKGDIKLLKEEKIIGVVGSRMPCDYAIKATETLIKNRPEHCVVSGLAKGIDAIAHINAKKSIGVLGCGIDYIYPYCNADLIKQMSTNQLIISEYPGMIKPIAYHFPFRNRLIAALSGSIYVMQAKLNSGTMTTVNEALELDRIIKVLPFEVFNEEGEGNLQLIQEGAQVIDTKEIYSLF